MYVYWSTIHPLESVEPKVPGVPELITCRTVWETGVTPLYLRWTRRVATETQRNSSYVWDNEANDPPLKNIIAEFTARVHHNNPAHSKWCEGRRVLKV